MKEPDFLMRLLFSLIIFGYSPATFGQEGTGGEAPV